MLVEKFGFHTDFDHTSLLRHKDIPLPRSDQTNFYGPHSSGGLLSPGEGVKSKENGDNPDRDISLKLPDSPYTLRRIRPE